MGRIMLAGTESGCGKTTVTIGILKALKNRGLDISSFKCGPDYIDPMFHREAIGIDSRNLDIFMVGEENVKQVLKENSYKKDMAIIEGVMGFYDGMSNTTYASSYHLSNITDTPVVLIVNTRGKAISICAQIKGYLEFATNAICGIILNNTRLEILPYYKEMIENNLNIPVLGCLPPCPEVEIKSRHLGLLTASEVEDLDKKIDILANIIEKSIDLDRLIKLSQKNWYNSVDNNVLAVQNTSQMLNILVSKDIAFSFHYVDNFRLLEKLGAKISFFSPLLDKNLPENTHGLILSGGYPEVFAKKLSANKSMKESIKNFVNSGLPVYAECGGFLYLQEYIKDAKGDKYPMVGVLKGGSELTNKLQNFGYIKLRANVDNILCKKGDIINAHEFHYSKSDFNGDSFTAEKTRAGGDSVTYPCIVTNENIFAGYPHMNFYGNVDFARNFVKTCKKYKTGLDNKNFF